MTTKITWLDKPFALFTGWDYYPSGGWGDYEANYSSLEEAMNNGKEKSGGRDEWWQVVDLRNLEIVVTNLD